MPRCKHDKNWHLTLKGQTYFWVCGRNGKLHEPTRGRMEATEVTFTCEDCGRYFRSGTMRRSLPKFIKTKMEEAMELLRKRGAL